MKTNNNSKCSTEAHIKAFDFSYPLCKSCSTHGIEGLEVGGGVRKVGSILGCSRSSGEARWGRSDCTEVQGIESETICQFFKDYFKSNLFMDELKYCAN